MGGLQDTEGLDLFSVSLANIQCTKMTGKVQLIEQRPLKQSKPSKSKRLSNLVRLAYRGRTLIQRSL